MFYKFLFVLFILYCIESVQSASKLKCDAKDKENIDELVARIMTYGRSDRKFPLNKTELKPYCKDQSTFVARVEEYKEKCLRERPKQIVAIVLYSIKNLISMYCRNPNSKRTKDLLSSASCANTVNREYKKCNDDYTDLLIDIGQSTDSKHQLMQMCCGYIGALKCARESASQNSKCSEEQVEANMNYIKGFFDNAINVICGDYNEESDKCTRVKLVQVKKINKNRPGSYFSPLVKVLANL